MRDLMKAAILTLADQLIGQLLFQNHIAEFRPSSLDLLVLCQLIPPPVIGKVFLNNLACDSME